MRFKMTFIMASGRELVFEVGRETKDVIIKRLDDVEHRFIRVPRGNRTCVINISQVERCVFDLIED